MREIVLITMVIIFWPVALFLAAVWYVLPLFSTEYHSQQADDRTQKKADDRAFQLYLKKCRTEKFERLESLPSSWGKLMLVVFVILPTSIVIIALIAHIFTILF